MLRRAGPRPVLREIDKSRGDRILDNIIANPFKLVFGSYPTVERFVLPKRLSRATENLVRSSRSCSLNSLSDATQFHTRLDQKMYMVGHDDISVKRIVPTKAVTGDE